MSEVIAAWLYVAIPMLGIGLALFLVVKREIDRQTDFFIDWIQRIENRLQYLERCHSEREREWGK